MANNILFGTQNIEKILFGQSEVSKIYLGQTLIWGAGGEETSRLLTSAGETLIDSNGYTLTY